MKYQILLNILDQIRNESPAEFKTYRPDPNIIDDINTARSKSFIHLYLKVKCGLTNFRDRHDHITDGTYDGGLDAYFIDIEKKQLLLIQSKFRTSENNFEEKSITSEDLIKMDLRRILKGETTDSNNNEFNHKIKSFQEKWRNVSNPASYDHIVVILGNLTKYNQNQIQRLIENPSFIIYDFHKTYNELLFPLCSGTYYDPKEIEITINLTNKEQSTLKQKVTTKYGDYQVRVLFVPAKEIGRILSRFKNSILKYNPRNYLSLSRNKVNQSIRESIINSKTNDFSLLNNGITMIGNNFKLSDSTGTIDVGQIIISSPQIINGGQTAYTLSKLYEQGIQDNIDFFQDKEVMLKVIILKDNEELNLKFIEEISNTTNQQSRVEEADRRSNEAVQIKLQENIFNEFGFFYERKRGEFFNGLDNNYFERDLLIDRYEFFRAYMAFKGEPRWARQKGSDTLFKEYQFKKIIDNSDDYKKMVLSYNILKKLYALEKSKDNNWGYGLRYGKMAVIAAISNIEFDFDICRSNLDEKTNALIHLVKLSWFEFENSVKIKPENKDYMEKDFDFDNYYKGKTVDKDIKEFFLNQNKNNH